jgi:hypothetical protein
MADGTVSGAIVIGVFVVSVIGLALTPTVASLVTTSVGNLSAYSSAQDILELFPLFWVILMIAIPIVAVGLYFKGI